MQGRQRQGLDSPSLEAHSTQCEGRWPVPCLLQGDCGDRARLGRFSWALSRSHPPRGLVHVAGCPGPRFPLLQTVTRCSASPRVAVQAVGYPEFGGKAGAPSAVHSLPDARRPDWKPGT